MELPNLERIFAGFNRTVQFFRGAEMADPGYYEVQRRSLFQELPESTSRVVSCLPPLSKSRERRLRSDTALLSETHFPNFSSSVDTTANGARS